jgi:hypothetical protein
VGAAPDSAVTAGFSASPLWEAGAQADKRPAARLRRIKYPIHFIIISPCTYLTWFGLVENDCFFGFIVRRRRTNPKKAIYPELTLFNQSTHIFVEEHYILVFTD